MAGYRLTPAAQADLIQIRRFTLERWGPGQSAQYLGGLRQAIRLLSENPTIGKVRPKVGDGVMSFPHQSHVIYYLLDHRKLNVFAVLHQSMVPDSHLTGRVIR